LKDTIYTIDRIRIITVSGLPLGSQPRSKRSRNGFGIQIDPIQINPMIIAELLQDQCGIMTIAGSIDSGGSWDHSYDYHNSSITNYMIRTSVANCY